MKKYQFAINLLLLFIISACQPALTQISGHVLLDGNPHPGAIVRIQTTEMMTISDQDGSFRFDGLNSNEIHRISVWAAGTYIAGGEKIITGTDDLVIELHALPLTDNPNYDWLSAYRKDNLGSIGEDSPCENCHSGSSGKLPFDEWIQDAHANAGTNIRFLTMYTGEDSSGNPGQLTKFGTTRDYGNYPLAPDPDQPYYGPGYKLDFPESAGNCSACHMPAAAVNNPYGTDPTSVEGVGLEGITCDFCHKIIDVNLDRDTDLPLSNYPGVLSLGFLRPPPGQQVFIGPYDDVASGEDTYSALQGESQICAACHYGVFADTVIYNSYGEWIDSAYADPDSDFYQTCQDCHMPPNGTDHFALLEKGGLVRDPLTIASHKMLGITDIDFMREAISLTADPVRDEEILSIKVSIQNKKAGHSYPTGSPLRHLILIVRAYDHQGVPLKLLSGPVLPDWVGRGNPDQGFYAELPGEVYAKVLEEIWNQNAPTGAYWNQTRILADNRIPALMTADSSYDFQAPDVEAVQVKVELVYRRAYIELQELKGWDSSDLLLAEINLKIR